MRKYDVEYTYNAQDYSDTVVLELITDDDIIQELLKVNQELFTDFDKGKLTINSVVAAGVFSDRPIETAF